MGDGGRNVDDLEHDMNGETGGGVDPDAVPAVPPSSISRLSCQRCGFPVPDRMWGCKNPCTNCGFIYPLGDCSD